MDQLLVGAGIAVIVGLLVVGSWWRRRSGSEASRRAHKAAQGREPPVELGETYEFGITEFTDHHSGKRVAVGKVEGFVVFAEDTPSHAAVGDVIEVKVLSFNRGETSADATVLSVK